MNTEPLCLTSLSLSLSLSLSIYIYILNHAKHSLLLCFLWQSSQLSLFYLVSYHSIAKNEMTGKGRKRRGSQPLYHFSLFFFFLANAKITAYICVIHRRCSLSLAISIPFFELFVISTIFRKSVNSLFKHIHLSFFIF